MQVVLREEHKVPKTFGSLSLMVTEYWALAKWLVVGGVWTLQTNVPRALQRALPSHRACHLDPIQGRVPSEFPSSLSLLSICCTFASVPQLFNTGVSVIMIYCKHLHWLMVLSSFHLWPGTCIPSSHAQLEEVGAANLWELGSLCLPLLWYAILRELIFDYRPFSCQSSRLFT